MSQRATLRRAWPALDHLIALTMLVLAASLLRPLLMPAA